MPDNDQTIIQLDKKTINKIAAGEVIERPASVVKELIENSIDAKATEISISVKGFGLEELAVIDNGIGMSKKDTLIAWKSHTTSKLKKIEDLDEITSLGFRGEALSSIAAISTLEILTKRKNDQIGTFIRVKGGEVELVDEKQCNIGTIVSVKNLFYNVPARKKFLKTKATELGHLIEVIHTYALIQPAIHFKFVHNNQELLNSPKSVNPLEPFISIYGTEVAKEMIRVEYEKNGTSIRGYTSKPELSRASRDFELLYVNKRGIKSKLISEAIEEAYKTLLMKNRYPITLIDVTIDSSEVDINIHPTKKEIRFKDPKKVFDIIKEAIVLSLQSFSSWSESKLLSKKLSKATQKQLKFEPIKELKPSLKQTSIDSSSLKSESTSFELNSQLVFTKPIKSKDGSSKQIAIESNVIKFSESFWLKPLNQVLALYVLCETNEGIAIVDIHAAHERVKYEELIEKYQKSKIELQEMLQPITFKLTREQIALIEDLFPQLQTLGINIELFGGNTYLLRKLPVIMDLLKTEEDILAFLDDIRSEIPKVNSLDDRIDLIIKKMACHSVVRSGETIPHNKILLILKQLTTCKKPFTCPHGRPTIIKISQKELEKEFKRII